MYVVGFVFVQDAPFLQGLASHGWTTACGITGEMTVNSPIICIMHVCRIGDASPTVQLVPVHPAVQLHVYPPGVFVQPAPFCGNQIVPYYGPRFDS